LLAPRPTSKLEDHPSSAVRGCLFNLFTAALHIGGRSSIRNLRTRHAVVTGTHIHGLLRSTLYIKLREANPIQAWRGSYGCRRLSLPKFLDNQHMKVTRFSALRTERLYPQKNIPCTYSCQSLGRHLGHSAAGMTPSGIEAATLRLEAQ